MFNRKPKYLEIDYHTQRLIVGVIAISLAPLVNFITVESLTSISASYHSSDWSRNIFVGFLFAISSFLISYNGENIKQLIASKLAAISALGVALFPCQCGKDVIVTPYVHYVSAGMMFIILSYFCFCFFKKARKKYADKNNIQALWRSYIYAFSGILIFLCIIVLILDHFNYGYLSSKIINLTFIVEYIALSSFGISWLTASRVLPIVTNESERLTLNPFRESK